MTLDPQLLNAALVFAGALAGLLLLGAFVKRLHARLKQRLAEEREKDEEAEKKIAEAAAKATEDIKQALSALERAASFGLNEAPPMIDNSERYYNSPEAREEARRALKLSIATSLFERGIFRRAESCIDAAEEFTRVAMKAGLLPRTKAEEELLGLGLGPHRATPPLDESKPYSAT